MSGFEPSPPLTGEDQRGWSRPEGAQPGTSADSPAGALAQQAESDSRQRSTRTARAAAIAVAGYEAAPAAERVIFGVTTSFAGTIAASRLINYVRERRRAMPRSRNLVRLLAELPSSNSVRVHHYLPGIAIGFTTGGVALLTRSGRLERWLSLPFGIGLALTADELRLMAGRSNPYWGGERFALGQGAAALVASVGFGIDFVRRGLREV
jgi:hypothetical protein